MWNYHWSPLSGEGFGLGGFQKHILTLSFLIAKENLQSRAHKSDRFLLFHEQSRKFKIECFFSDVMPPLLLFWNNPWPLSWAQCHHLGGVPGKILPVGAGPPRMLSQVSAFSTTHGLWPLYSIKKACAPYLAVWDLWYQNSRLWLQTFNFW